MKMLFKQRMFSWLCSYDIFDESGEVLYKVKGQLSWGHCFKIFDRNDNCVGMVKQRLLTFMPKFEIYMDDTYMGCISREFAFFKPKYNIECKDWQVEGDFFEWDYDITDSRRETVATVSKQLFNWTDTYSIEVYNPADALVALMLVLAIDAEKCSRNSH